MTLTPFERDLHARTVKQLAEALSSEQLRAAWATGARLDVGTAIEQALAGWSRGGRSATVP